MLSQMAKLLALALSFVYFVMVAQPAPRRRSIVLVHIRWPSPAVCSPLMVTGEQLSLIPRFDGLPWS